MNIRTRGVQARVEHTRIRAGCKSLIGGLADERLRDAEGLINKVRNDAEVKDQKHIVKHLSEAMLR